MTAQESQITPFAATAEAVNLEQALIDFEIANARVIALTKLVADLSQELADARIRLATRPSAPELPAARQPPPERSAMMQRLRESDRVQHLVWDNSVLRPIADNVLRSPSLRRALRVGR